VNNKYGFVFSQRSLALSLVAPSGSSKMVTTTAAQRNKWLTAENERKF